MKRTLAVALRAGYQRQGRQGRCNWDHDAEHCRREQRDPHDGDRLDAEDVKKIDSILKWRIYVQ